MLRAVLFDLDGTLMDHEAARAAGLQAHLDGWLGDLDPHERVSLADEWKRLEALHYEEYARGECSYAEQRRRRVLGMHTALEREPAEDLTPDAWFEGYFRHYSAAWRAFDDVLPALAVLRSADPPPALAVVTNGESESQTAKLAAIGLGEHFRTIVASGSEGVAKPEPQIFALTCERLGVEPDKTAHVGDRLDLDAEGAAAAGLRGIWLDREGMGPCPAHVERISTLHALPDTLRRLSYS